MWNWLRTLTSGYKKVFEWIVGHLSRTQREYAEYVVREAALRFIDNAERREWAVKQIIRRFQVSESVARLLVELAVRLIKQQKAASR